MRIDARSPIPTAQGSRREMSAVGIFAGRGDVILAMGLALIVGIWIGWQLRRFANWISEKRKSQ